jgi:hypothetical protein
MGFEEKLGQGDEITGDIVYTIRLQGVKRGGTKKKGGPRNAMPPLSTAGLKWCKFS